ncbi:MAG: hypothetical protein WC414_01790 [Patescibacteria group bacterium]
MNNFIGKIIFFLKNVIRKNVILDFLSSRKTVLFFVFLFLFFGFSIKYVFALNINDIAGGVMQGFTWLMLSLAQLFIALTVFFLRFFITLASYNDFINTGVVKVGWYMVRDLANMFFIIALLVIAFATILGIEKYEWKKSMVKLVIMAILINFSNMIAQLIIDVAHVFTVTFLNAISATAGGNLISMLNLDKMMEMVQKSDLKWDNTIQLQVQMFGAGAAAFIFSVLAAVSIGAYCVIMLYRVVILWALIILSPLAYLFSTMPATEKYSEEWWKEFINYVTVAPLMVFFLWLAFATLGSGDILTEIQKSSGIIRLNQTEEIQSASLAQVTEWTNMANFLVAIVFLMVGIRKVKETGVEGVGAIDKAMDWGKKAIQYGTGYVAGRWMAGKAKDFAVEQGAQLAAPIRAIGTVIKAKMPGIGDLARNERAKKLEKGEFFGLQDKDDKGEFKHSLASRTIGEGLGWVATQFWQTSGRSKKKKEDWEKVIQNTKELVEENYSTSGTLAGQFKLKSYVELKQAESRGEAKKAEKEALMAEKLFGSSEEYRKSIETEVGSRENAEQAKIRLENKKIKIEEKMRSGSKKNKYGQTFAEVLKGKQYAQAEQDEIKREKQKRDLLLQADYFNDPTRGNNVARANLLRQKANTLLFTDVKQVLDAGGSNSNERANAQAALSTNIAELHNRRNISKDPLEIENIDKQIKYLYKQMLAMVSISNGGSAYESETAQITKLKGLGPSDSRGAHEEMLEDMTFENTWQRFYAEMTGKWTTATGKELHTLLNEWINTLGDTPEEQQDILRQLALSLREQKSQFNTHIPIFKEETDRKTGRTIYHIPSAEDLDPKKVAQAQYEGILSWYKSNDIEPSKSNTAAANRDRKGEIKEVTHSQALLNAEMISGKSNQSISSLKNGAWGDLEALKDLKNDPEKNKEEYQKEYNLKKKSIIIQLRAFAHKSKDEAAFKAVVSKIQEAVKFFGVEEKQLKDIFRDRSKYDFDYLKNNPDN